MNSLAELLKMRARGQAPDVAESASEMFAFMTPRTIAPLEFFIVCLFVFLLLLVSLEDEDHVDENGEAELVILERSIKVSCCRWPVARVGM